MQQTLETTVGDSGFAWQFTLQDNDGNARDLTSATGTFRAQFETGTVVVVEGAITLVTPASGICKYTVQSGDFDTPGRYYGELEILFSGGEVSTFEPIVIIVRPQLPRNI